MRPSVIPSCVTREWQSSTFLLTSDRFILALCEYRNDIHSASGIVERKLNIFKKKQKEKNL